MPGRFLLFPATLSLFFASVSAQSGHSTPIPGYKIDLNGTGADQIFSNLGAEGHAVSGSPWFSPRWISGKVRLTNGDSLPHAGETLFLNYNKSTDLLYHLLRDSVVAFPTASVTEFRLEDSVGIHHFVKVPRISLKFFLEEMTEPGKGFMLYRKKISRLRTSDEVPTGYGNSGAARSWAYTEYQLFYMLYPDKKKYLHFWLNDAGVRRNLTRINDKAARFLRDHPGDIDVRMLFSLCEALNDSGPDPLPVSR